MSTVKKDYYRLEELAVAWDCEIEDIFHHFQQGRIELGFHVSAELFYGLDRSFRTIGVYLITGVLTIPQTDHLKWEFGDTQDMEAWGFGIEKDYPPNFGCADDFGPDCLAAPLFPWAPNCNWDNPETDHHKIEQVMKGCYDGIAPREQEKLIIPRSEVVVHAVERIRFERENSIPGMLGGQSKKSKRWAIDIALESACEQLKKEYLRTPLFSEIVKYFKEERDTTSFIVKIDDTNLVWVDKKSNPHEISLVKLKEKVRNTCK